MSQAGCSRRDAGWRRVAVVGAVLLSMVLMPGCGGSGNGGGVTGGGTGVRTVIFEDTWALDAVQYIPLEGPVNASGTMDVIVDWTFATNDVDIVITDSTCTDEMFELLQCDDLASTTSITAKPETVSVNVTAGNYRIFVINIGPESESGTIQVGLTR